MTAERAHKAGDAASGDRPRDPAAAATATSAGGRRAVFGGLRSRFVLWLLLALLPVALLNIIQGGMALDRAREAARDRLLAGALYATAIQENTFAGAEHLLRALAGVPEIRNGADACPILAREIVGELGYAVNLVRIADDGGVVCAAVGGERDVSFAESPWWMEMRADRAFSISGARQGLLSGQRILVAALPLFGPGGNFDGALTLAIDLAWFNTTLRDAELPAGATTALLNRNGNLIAGDVSEAVLARAAETWDTLRANPTPLFARAREGDGTPWTYVVAPILGGNAVVVTAAPYDAVFSWTYLNVATSFLLPILMLVLAMGVIWFATDRLVLRWLAYLRRISAAYAAGHYALRLGRLEAAPAEFRAVGRSVETMVDAIQERDRRLREGLAQKTALAREIHHRIKNSLQIVTSLLSLQAAQIVDKQARRSFETVRGRVDALALAHRLFRETDHGSEVELRDLVTELAAQYSSAAARNVTIATRVEECALPTDVAVPLALFLNEALEALSRGSAERGGAALSIVGDRPDPRHLRVRVAVIGDAAGDGADMSPGLLIEGFAGQLRGRVEVLDSAGSRSIGLIFPDPCQ